MSYLITLGLVETNFVPVVHRVKMVLDGATTIKRERVLNKVINELVVFDGTVAADGACVGVGVGAAAGVVAADGAGAGQHEGATSCTRCCGFLCEKCKKHDEDSIMYLQKLSEAGNELEKQEVCEGHCVKGCAACIYSKGQTEKRIICQGNANLKRKMFEEIPRSVMKEVVTEYKRLNIYRHPSVAEREAWIFEWNMASMF